MLAFVLALLRIQLVFFHGRPERETQGTASISTRINHATPQSPVIGPWNAFLVILWKSLIHRQQGDIVK